MHRHWEQFARSGGAVWTVVAVVGVYALLTSEEFRALANLTNLLRQMVVLGLASLAQFVVVLARGVDLSLGASVRLASIVAAIVMAGSDDAFLLGLLLAVAVSLAIGVTNGLIVSRLRLEPFIATLATGAIVSGVALYVASTPKGRASPWWQDFYDQAVGPIPALAIVFGIIIASMWLLLDHTPWGRHLYAVGGDPAVSRLSGIGVGRVTVSAYALAGLIAGCAGMVIIGRTGIGDSSAAVALEFESLAVVVIGGASLSGGRGRIIGVLGGVVLFSMVGNVFTLLRVDVWYQQLARGFIVLLAAALFVQRRTTSQAFPPVSQTPLQRRGGAATR